MSERNISIASASILLCAAHAMAQHCQPGWDIIGQGPNGVTSAMTVFEESGVSFLVAGGSFTSAGGTATGAIARWDGSVWSRVGTTTFSGDVRTLLAFNDGISPTLYAGGSFSGGTGFDGRSIAKWNGSTWAPLMSGLNASATIIVNTLAVHDSGSGLQVHAGGQFSFAASSTGGAANLGRWTGQMWEPVGGGTIGNIASIHSVQLGNERHLFVNGWVMHGASGMVWIASYDGIGWTDRTGSWRSGKGRFVEFDDGAGPGLYLVGSLSDANPLMVDGLFRWINEDWAVIGIMDSMPLSASVGDFGAGPALYVGGAFSTVDHVPMSHVASWNGQEWTPTGGDVLIAPGGGGVSSLAMFQHAGHPMLLAGGAIGHDPASPGSPAYFARFDSCEGCYANCDGSTAPPVLNIDDFTCFITEFAQAQTLPVAQQITHYANCDRSTSAPILNIEDFTCFINAFAAGCP